MSPRATLKACPTAGCPELIPRTASYCDACTAKRDAARPGTVDRGYGAAHKALRALVAPKVATGGVLCCRCNTPIAAGEPWALDHEDEDRSRYAGVSHARCNDAAGAAQGNRNR